MITTNSDDPGDSEGNLYNMAFYIDGHAACQKMYPDSWQLVGPMMEVDDYN